MQFNSQNLTKILTDSGIVYKNIYFGNFWKAKSVSCIGSHEGSCKNNFSTSVSRLRLVGGRPCGSCGGKTTSFISNTPRCSLDFDIFWLRKESSCQEKNKFPHWCAGEVELYKRYIQLDLDIGCGFCKWENMVWPVPYWPCSAGVKAGQPQGVWWARTGRSIPSPAGIAAGPWGPQGAHLYRAEDENTNGLKTN